MVLFLVYVTIHELNMLFGNGELYRLFFRWRSSEAKLPRRRRARLLIRLNRLTRGELDRGIERARFARKYRIGWHSPRTYVAAHRFGGAYRIWIALSSLE